MRGARGLVAVVAVLAALGGCSDDGDDEPKTFTSLVAEPVDLGIHPVVGVASGTEAQPTTKHGIILRDTGSHEVLEIGPAQLDATDVEGAEAAQTPNSPDWMVDLVFTEEGNEKFGDLTAEAACAAGPARRIAIVVDGKIISSPEVTGQCGERLENGTQISGGFDREEAEALAEGVNGW